MPKNPFILAFGEVPELMIDAEQRMAVIVSDLISDRPNLRNFMIYGVRGSGKTCLLRAIEQKLSVRDEFIFINLDMGDGEGKNLLNQLAAVLADISDMKKLYLKADVKLNIWGNELTLENKNPYIDTRIEIEKMLRVLSNKNKKVVITLDEVANTSGVREFASAYKELSGQGLPVYLLMAGLKENIEGIKQEPRLTFLRRTFPIELGGLNHTAIREEYKKILHVDSEKAEELAYMTKRYSFAFQALGFTYLEYGDDWLKYYDSLLASYVYKPLWDSLSDKDRFITVIINNTPADSKGKREIGKILEIGNLKKNELTPYIKRLKNATVITSNERGTIDYTYPRFDVFVRNMSENM